MLIIIYINMIHQFSLYIYKYINCDKKKKKNNLLCGSDGKSGESDMYDTGLILAANSGYF